MKKILKIIALIIVALAIPMSASAIVTTISNGGTGTGTAPTYGKILVGNSAGAYTFMATSALGITGGGGSTASSTILGDNNTFSGQNVFSNIIRSTTTNATTTNFSSTNSIETNLRVTNAPIFSALTGILKGNDASALTIAANGTDYTLITANTCGAGNHFSAVTAAGVLTCTADIGGGGTYSFYTLPAVSPIPATQATNTPVTFTQGAYASFFTATSTAATSTFANFNGQYWATTTTVDLGKQVMNYYNKGWGDTVTVNVPAGSYFQDVGTYPININTAGKKLKLVCAGGDATVINLTGVGTSTILNAGNSGVLGLVKNGYGVFGCSFNGNLTTGQMGIQVGGNQGAQGAVLEDVGVFNTDTGIILTDNIAGGVDWHRVNSQFNNKNLMTQMTIDAGEGINIIGFNFSDCQIGHMDRCVDFASTIGSSIHLMNGRIDDGQLYVADGNLRLTVTNTHFENPNVQAVGKYTFIKTGSGGYGSLSLIGNTFWNGATTTAKSPYVFIDAGNPVDMSGNSFSSDGIAMNAIASTYGDGRIVNTGSFVSFGSAATLPMFSTSTEVNFTIDHITHNVGIGTSSPYEKLAVGGNAVINGNLTITGTCTGCGAGSGASTTLLANNNTFSGQNIFNNILRSTTTNATTTSLAVTSITSALHLANATGGVVPYGGTSCTNQFVRSLNAGGAGTCATVANTDLTNSLITINGSSVSLGGSITVASTTLLANNNTWTGGNIFVNSTTTSATTTNFFTTNSVETNLRVTNAPIFTALSGILKGNGASALTIASNGTDYTLITANTCAGGSFFNTVTASGVFGCTASGGGGASSTLLADNNTWSGNNMFLASTTIGGGTLITGLTINGGATSTFGYNVPNGKGYNVTDTSGKQTKLGYINSSNDLHLLSDFTGNATYIGFNNSSPLTFGSSCCGGSTFPTITFSPVNDVIFSPNGTEQMRLSGATARLGISSTTAGTLLSLGNGANFVNISELATSTFSKGVNINTGCFAINGTCLSTGAGGSGASTTLLADNNIFTGNNVFSLLTATRATTTYATTTFLNVSGGATTSFANGISLTSGCFRDSSGVCISAGAGSSAVGGTGAIQYANGASFAGNLKHFWDNTNEWLGIGTSTPWARLSLQGAYGSQANLIDIASSTNASGSATTSLFNISASGASTHTHTDNGTGQTAFTFISNTTGLITSFLNTVADSQLNVRTTAGYGAAIVNLFSTAAEYGNIAGYVSDNLKWRIGRAGGADGLYFYVFDGATQVLQLKDNLTAYFTGKIGVGTSTPWGKLSIVDTGVSNPLFTIATSSSVLSMFTVTATTTTMSTASSTDSGVRFSLGDSSIPAAGYLDQLMLNGRLNTGDWHYEECNPVGSMNISADTSNACKNFAYNTDSNTVGLISNKTTTGSMYFQQTNPVAVANAGNGIFFGVGNSFTQNLLQAGTNTPVMETSLGIAGNSTGTLTFFGFTNLSVSGTTYETEPTQGCYVAATSSIVGNWRAICKDSAGGTMVDTGFSSTTIINVNSTAFPTRMRVELTDTRFTVFMSTTTTNGYRKVANITTNIPKTINLVGGIHYGWTTAGAASTKTIRFGWLKAWWKTPNEIVY